MIKKIAKFIFGKRITDRLFLKFPVYTNFYKNLTRLYPFLLVGGSLAYRRFLTDPLDKEKVVDLTLPRQNMFACNECIRHFFSILKEGDGVVCLAVSERELNNESMKLLPFHYSVFKGYLYPDRNHNHLKMKYPLLFQPLWTLESIGIAMPESIKYVNGGGNKLRIINEFCKDRDLSFLLVTLGDWTEESIKEIEIQNIRHCREQEFRDIVARSKLKCVSF